jgi:ketosteroid isomerase-like protein
MLAALPPVISRYFDSTAERDTDAIIALFADDATLVDEGEARHGPDAIRAWRDGPATAWTYTTELLETETVGPDRVLVTGRLTGNFPGGTAELKWDFTLSGGRIKRLVIAP